MAWLQSRLVRQASLGGPFFKGCFPGPQVVAGESSDNCSSRAHGEGGWPRWLEGWIDQELDQLEGVDRSFHLCHLVTTYVTVVPSTDPISKLSF